MSVTTAPVTDPATLARLRAQARHANRAHRFAAALRQARRTVEAEPRLTRDQLAVVAAVFLAARDNDGAASS